MFMRYISHEIRTPLNTVFMGLKLIEKELADNTLDPTKAITMVFEIKVAAEAALAVLNDLLMLNKVKEGLLVLELTDEDPLTLIKDAVEGFNIQVIK